MAYKGKNAAVLASAVSNLHRWASPGKKEPPLNKRPHWLTCRQASQTFSWFLWDCPAHCGLCTPGQMVLDGIMKKTEKPLIDTKPVSSIFPRRLHRLLPLGSCPDSFHHGVWCRSINGSNPFLPMLLLIIFFNHNNRNPSCRRQKDRRSRISCLAL